MVSFGILNCVIRKKRVFESCNYLFKFEIRFGSGIMKCMATMYGNFKIVYFSEEKDEKNPMSYWNKVYFKRSIVSYWTTDMII